MMKIVDIRAKTADELKDELLQLKKEQFNLRFQSAAGHAAPTGRTREVRRTIARIKTIQGGKVAAPGKSQTTVKAKTAKPAATAKAKKK